MLEIWSTLLPSLILSFPYCVYKKYSWSITKRGILFLLSEEFLFHNSVNKGYWENWLWIHLMQHMTEFLAEKLAFLIIYKCTCFKIITIFFSAENQTVNFNHYKVILRSLFWVFSLQICLLELSGYMNRFPCCKELIFKHRIPLSRIMHGMPQDTVIEFELNK